MPYEPHWNESQHDSERDVLHGVFNELLNMLGLMLIPGIAGYMPFAALWPEHWPFVLQLLLAITVADCGITLAHYLIQSLEKLMPLATGLLFQIKFDD
ncbi:hypothetical protein [Undibacterium sp. TJN19]|uniref:hypothetical protein n=1 Tax=Undibacterium sp. TJN19 TaxID=3413055 RepID=UPI003BF2022D